MLECQEAWILGVGSARYSETLGQSLSSGPESHLCKMTRFQTQMLLQVRQVTSQIDVSSRRIYRGPEGAFNLKTVELRKRR